MDICFAIAFTSAVLWRVQGPLTLSWQHSVELFRIEEDWRAGAEGLLLTEVRTGGLGAGVDVPADAQWVNGWLRSQPALPPQPQVVLANSRHGRGYRACWAGQCAELGSLVGVVDRPLVMAPCDGGP